VNIIKVTTSMVSPFVIPIIRAFLNASMEYVNGFPSAISLNISGIMLIGYIEVACEE